MEKYTLDLEFYRNLWGGDRANVPVPPDNQIVYLFGFPYNLGNGQEFYDRYATVEGIQKQYNEFTHSVGQIYYIDPFISMRTQPYIKAE